MEIRLAPGDKLTVLLGTDSDQVDGEFEIHFDTEKYPNQLVIAETAGLPGNVKGEASSVLYCESWQKWLDTDGAER